MCEALVRVLDKAAPDDPMIAYKTRRGDVIVVRPDGWKWSERELTNPAWRILRFAGLPETSLGDLLESVYDKDGRGIMRRAKGIDLDTVDVSLSSKLALADAAVIDLSTTDQSAVFASVKVYPSPLVVIG